MRTIAVLTIICLLCAGCATRYDNPLDDPNWVPIAVNVQSVYHAHTYANAGINTYIGIDDVTTELTGDYQVLPAAGTLKILQDLGIYAMVFPDQWGHLRDHPAIIGWLSRVDAPDNIQPETGRAMPLGDYLAAAKRVKAFDATRPYTVCFGQGVINDLFQGRGIERSEYPKYLAAADFIQYDVHPITNAQRVDGENYLELTGQGVSRLRQWTDDAKPVMCWIETTHIKDPAKAPTPAQTNCQVWITMAHGARGVGYFCHDFTVPERRASALSRDTDMLAQLRRTNAKLLALAPIINAPLATEPKAVPARPGRVIASTKTFQGDTIILAVNVRAPATVATIAIDGLQAGDTIDVLQEGRTLTATKAGQFTDTFAGYQEHVYRVKR